MTELLLFPRLPAAIARSRMEGIRGKTPAELQASASETCAEAIYAATGGSWVKPQLLAGVRGELVSRARSLGFPDKNAGEVRFDWIAAPILLTNLGMHPGEASRNEVWSFMAIQLLPDLATWRFPKQNTERFLGGTRNAFQRLWWRAYLLEDRDNEDPWHLVKLPEDALVGLMERPGISSNPFVTCMIAKAISELMGTLPSSLREEGWRLAYRRIRQRAFLTNLDAVEEAELQNQVRVICQRAAKQTRAEVEPA